MKQILYAVLLVVLSATTVLAQKVSIDWGEGIDSKTTILKILGEDDKGNVYALSAKGKKSYLEKFKGEGLEASFSKEFIFPEINGEEPKLIQLYLVDNTIIAIADVYLKKEDQYIVKAYEYSLSGVLTENTKEVLKLNVKSRLKAGVTGAVLSQDRKSFLVHNVNFDDKDDNAIIVKVFDSKLNVINEYNEEIKLKSSSQKAYVTIGNFILNNLGNVYFTKELKYYKGAFSFTSEYDTDRDYFIVIMDSKGTRNEVPVELKNLKVARMGLRVDKDNTIKLAGFYYKRQTKGLFKGVFLRGTFYVELAPESRKKVAESSAEFSDEMMLEYRSEKQLAKGVYLPSNFYVKEIRNKPDGGTVIIAEFFEATISSGNNLMENIKYLYGV